jgi:hypothetical protein
LKHEGTKTQSHEDFCLTQTRKRIKGLKHEDSKSLRHEVFSYNANA